MWTEKLDLQLKPYYAGYEISTYCVYSGIKQEKNNYNFNFYAISGKLRHIMKSSRIIWIFLR